MQVTAQLNNLRISPRKVRLSTAVLKGMDVIHAKFELEHRARRASRPIVKLLDSALANAHNNFGLVKENMYIKQIIVNEGPKLKRFEPKGFGTVSPIEKKTAHIKVILEEKVPGMKAGPKTETKKIETTGHSHEEKPKPMERKPTYAKSSESDVKKNASWGGLKGVRKFFRRKTI